MPNMESIVRQHNSRILKEVPQDSVNECNCQRHEECPLKGKCLTDNVVYKAVVTTDNDSKQYIGSCSTTFKLRFGNHKNSLKYEKNRNFSELSNYIWELKNENKNFKIDWDIIKRVNCYKKGSKRCNLCFAEKMYILTFDRKRLINKGDLMIKCLHKHKFKLKNILCNNI